MTARSFSIPTTVPLTTAPSCTPCPKDSSSILAKSSREGVAELVAVAMKSPDCGQCRMVVDGVSSARPESPQQAFGAAKDRRPGTYRAIETMVQVRRAIRKRAEQAWSSTTETRSAALPACSDGFDDIDGGPECGVYIQMRGIEQVRVQGGFQGRGRPLRVPLVPAADVGQYVSLLDPSAQFQ